jgi:hypothetical protein
MRHIIFKIVRQSTLLVIISLSYFVIPTQVISKLKMILKESMKENKSSYKISIFLRLSLFVGKSLFGFLFSKKHFGKLKALRLFSWE